MSAAHNALAFQKNWDIYSALREKYPNEGPDFIDDKFEKSTNRVFVAGFKDTNLEAKKHIVLPRFGAVPDHDETIALQKRYENDREKIIETLAKNNFLETIIEYLTSN